MSNYTIIYNKIMTCGDGKNESTRHAVHCDRIKFCEQRMCGGRICWLVADDGTNVISINTKDVVLIYKEQNVIYNSITVRDKAIKRALNRF